MANFEEFSRVYLNGGNMAAEEDLIQRLVVSRLLHLNAIAYGIVAGLLTGFALFIATIWLVLKGGDVVGPHLGLLGQYFLGYETTPVGSLVGFAYGFLFGFIGAYLGANIYNWIVNHSKGKSSDPPESSVGHQ